VPERARPAHRAEIVRAADGAISPRYDARGSL